MVNLAVFASGKGTNCENLIKHFRASPLARVSLVVSNKADSGALDRAGRLGVPARVVPKADLGDPGVILPLLKEYSVDFIVLAGFLLVVPGFLIDEYEGRMVNLHPALLPKFGGKGMYGHRVHEAVKAAGERQTGITIHWVSREVDGGKVIAQFSAPVSPDDTPEDIAAKVHDLEKRHFPLVIDKVLLQRKLT